MSEGIEKRPQLSHETQAAPVTSNDAAANLKNNEKAVVLDVMDDLCEGQGRCRSASLRGLLQF